MSPTRRDLIRSLPAGMIALALPATAAAEPAPPASLEVLMLGVLDYPDGTGTAVSLRIRVDSAGTVEAFAIGNPEPVRATWTAGTAGALLGLVAAVNGARAA
jgi:hypothetical protein